MKKDRFDKLEIGDVIQHVDSKISYVVTDNFGEIADNPMLGKNYEGITDQLFGFKAGRHLIFYRIINKDLVEITRILHEQMDLKNRVTE